MAASIIIYFLLCMAAAPSLCNPPSRQLDQLDPLQFPNYVLHLIVCQQSVDIRPLVCAIIQVNIFVLLNRTYLLHASLKQTL